MKIVFLSRWFPYPANNGSKIRIYNLLKGLAAHHDVSLISFIDPNWEKNTIEPIRKICDHVQVVPWKPYYSNSIRALMGFFSKTPRALYDTFSIEMRDQIIQSIRDTHPDLIIASQIDMACYAEHFSEFPALFEEAELGIYRQKLSTTPLPWQKFRNSLTWIKQAKYISQLLDHFRACTVVSDAEKILLSQVAQKSKSIIEVIPNCIDVNDSREVIGTPQSGSLIFPGSLSFFANHDAMIWFVGNVLPILRTRLPGIHLTITGDHANLPLPSLENVTLAGYVNDVRPMISSSWASIAPIRIGGGTRLKILEAMALSTPVVATTKGVEGLDVQHNVHVLIADSPDAFAEQIIRLSTDSELRRHLIENAYQLVCKKYNWSVVMPLFLDLVEKSALH